MRISAETYASRLALPMLDAFALFPRGERMRRMCTIALALCACGDNGAVGDNPHLGGSDAIVDAPTMTDSPAIDAMDDAAPALTCGTGGPEVLPLPPTGVVSGGGAIGPSMFAGSCGGGWGAEVIYHVP